VPKFPEPPGVAGLRQVPASVKSLDSGTVWWWLYFRGGRHPTFWATFRRFGPLGGRFDTTLPSNSPSHCGYSI
jgi:hypothetical protein